MVKRRWVKWGKYERKGRKHRYKKQKGIFVTEIKVPLTDTNKEYYTKINVSHGDLKNSEYETYITGVNKDSMGYFYRIKKYSRF